ncbi:HPr family phosphocarrier protein [candidate division WOR-3 bacterium]|jgi:phosphotransferase system HPr (HPr) family protein|nr:HPr family phosphocarrier protein [candidate division WOR-3 bacterium]MCK4672438.1 HPr family phosphocarrier protein [candidate division WOR-3 bacterium]
MIKETVKILNENGLHALPASRFVKLAEKFKSSIMLTKDEIEVSGKSIMGILTLACEKGSKIILVCDGKDEKEAMEALKKILEGQD